MINRDSERVRVRMRMRVRERGRAEVNGVTKKRQKRREKDS